MFHLSLSSSLPSRRNTHTYTPISVSFLPHLRSLSQLNTTIIIFETFSLRPPSLPQPHQNSSPPFSSARVHILLRFERAHRRPSGSDRRKTRRMTVGKVKFWLFLYFLSFVSFPCGSLILSLCFLPKP